MIAFDLQCEHRHAFEAWFASSAAYESQRVSGLIACPVCASTAVQKAVMAPRIAPGGRDNGIGALLPRLAALQAEMLKGSKWVGDRFVQQARAMADGEADKAVIHGTASPAEARALHEDGIGVIPLVVPVVPPEKLN